MEFLNRIFYSKRNQMLAVLFHALLGLVTVYTNVVLIAYFLFLSAYTILYIIKNRNAGSFYNYYLAYVMGMEIFFRMGRTSPFIPYEVGKYVMVFVTLFVIYIQKYNPKMHIGMLFILLSIPSIFVQVYSNELFEDVVFNCFGLFGMGILLYYFHQQKFTEKNFRSILITFLLPVISILIFVTLKTPILSEDDFQLGANFATTGGFGSNQVSTLYGFVLLILLVYKMNNSSIFSLRGFDDFLLVFCFYRIFLSFSRGGLVCFIISLIVLIIYNWNNENLRKLIRKPGIILSIIVILLGGLISFYYINKLSGNKLVSRYQGKNQNVQLGVVEGNASIATSGRSDIFENDIEIFLNNIILGVGPGGSKYVRKQYGTIFEDDDPEDIASLSVAHVEFSRLLAEHGVFGIIMILLITYITYEIITSKKNTMARAIAAALICYALTTTFHSAMRISLSPFLFALSAAMFVPQNRKIKPAKATHETNILR